MKKVRKSPMYMKKVRKKSDVYEKSTQKVRYV